MSPVLSRRSSVPEDQRGQTRQAIVDATERLLATGRPFAELSVGEISTAAGVSRPTFYAYFDDKRALVLHLGAALEQDLLDAAEPWLEFEDVPLRDTLAGVLAVFTRHRAAVAAITEAASYDPEVTAFWEAFHDRYRPGAERRIAVGHPALAPQDVVAPAYALVWMTERTFTAHLARPAVEETALVDQVTWLWRAATGAS